MSVHQTLMKEAAKKHRDGMKYVDFLLQLDVLERRATILGNLNYQVENGGFNQWRANGYHQPLLLIRDAVEAIDTEAGRSVLETVNEAMYASTHDESLDHCDLPYYKVREQFIKDCEAYFAKQMKPASLDGITEVQGGPMWKFDIHCDSCKAVKRLVSADGKIDRIKQRMSEMGWTFNPVARCVSCKPRK